MRMSYKTKNPPKADAIFHNKIKIKADKSMHPIEWQHEWSNNLTLTLRKINNRIE